MLEFDLRTPDSAFYFVLNLLELTDKLLQKTIFAIVIAILNSYMIYITTQSIVLIFLILE